MTWEEGNVEMKILEADLMTFTLSSLIQYTRSFPQAVHSKDG